MVGRRISVQRLLENVQKLDESYSTRVFASSLPRFAEAIFSVPGNFCGLAPMLLFGPLWVGVYVGARLPEEGEPLIRDLSIMTYNEPDWKLVSVAFLCSAPFMILWFLFLMGNSAAVRKGFGGKFVFIVMPLVSNALTALLMADSRQRSLSLYPLWLWTPSMWLILLLKNRANRRRPCTKQHLSYCIEKKNFPMIPRLLTKVAANGSFPSGDVAGAMAFVLPMAVPFERPDLIVAVVSLVSLGRMYFLAHHLGDTIVGSIVPLMVHYISIHLIGIDMLTMPWWYPLVSHVVFSAWAATIGQRVANRR